MDFTGLTYLDYAVVFILICSTLFAFIRGFIGSFLSLGGWILAIYLSYTLFPSIKPLMEEKIKSPVIIVVLGHAGLLIGFLIVFGILNILSTNMVKGMTTGIIDRSLGAGFGIIRGAIIISFIFLIVSTGVGIFNGVDQEKDEKGIEVDTMPKWLSNSKSFPYMNEGSHMLASFIPGSFYERFQEIYNDISRKSMDDRFVENSVQKLRKSISPNELKLIDQRTEEAALTQSSEEAKYNKLKELVNSYEANKVDRDISGKRLLSSDEMTRLHSILREKQMEIKNIKSKLDAASDCGSIVEAQ